MLFSNIESFALNALVISKVFRGGLGFSVGIIIVYVGLGLGIFSRNMCAMKNARAAELACNLHQKYVSLKTGVCSFLHEVFCYFPPKFFVATIVLTVSQLVEVSCWENRPSTFHSFIHDRKFLLSRLAC